MVNPTDFQLCIVGKTTRPMYIQRKDRFVNLDSIV